MKSIFFFSLVFGFIIPSIVWANSCREQLFQGGIQVHAADGKVRFRRDAHIINNDSSLINALTVQNSKTSTQMSCGDSACVSSSEVAPKQTLATFKKTNVDSKLTYASKESSLLGGPGQYEFGRINMESESVVTINSEGHNELVEYQIDVLTMGYKSTLNLRPGTYWVRKLTVGAEASINVIGDGTVRLNVLKPLASAWNAKFNVDDLLLNGDPNRFVLIAYSSVKLNRNYFSGYLYSASFLKVGSGSEIYGSVVAANAALRNSALITYVAPSSETNLGQICDEDVVVDSDLDGVLDSVDLCPDTSIEKLANDSGCADNQLDSDLDGVTDDIDQCLSTKEGSAVDEVGCGLSQYLSCKEYLFGNAIQTHDVNGKIDFGYNSSIENPSSAILNAKVVQNNNGSNKLSCGDVTCVESGDSIDLVQLSPFVYSQSDQILEFGYGESVSVDIADGNDYDQIIVPSSGKLDITVSNSSSDNIFIVDQLVLNYDSTLNLAPGTYWIKNLTVASKVKINVVGEGAAKLYVSEALSVGYEAKINIASDTAMLDPNKLVLVAYDKLDFNTSQLAGYVVAHGDVSLGYKFSLTGSIVAANITTNSEALISYVATSAQTDLGQICENTAPIATNKNYSLSEDDSLPIVLTGYDQEKSELTFSIASSPLYGELVGIPPELTYVPTLNFYGTDSFTYSVSDGLLVSEPATVSLRVTPVNDAPRTAAQFINTNEDTSYEIVLFGDDVDGDELLYTVTSLPLNGQLVGEGRTLLYIPNPQFNGTDSFIYVVNDGELTSNFSLVTIIVKSLNDKPTVTNSNYSLNEDETTDILLLASDIDQDLLTYNLISQPANGTLSGTVPNLIFTPNNNFNGTDSFTFSVNDGTVDSELATVSITVVAVNDAPVANAVSVESSEDTAVEFVLTGSDEEGDVLTYALRSQPTNGTLSGTAPNLIFTPNNNFNGNDSFTFSVNDGTVDSELATVSITVVAVNDAPIANSDSVATNEDTAVEFVLTGSDEEGDALSYALVSQPSNGTLSGSAPNLIFTPAANFNGTDSFTFSVNDGAVDSELATVSITVVAVNDAPIANSLVVETNEDTSVEFTLTGSDEEGDALTYALVSQPSNGTLSGSAPNLIFTPAANFNGADSFTFSVNDGAVDSELATVSITVVAVNDAPVANSSSVETSEDTSVEFVLTGSDEEGDALTYALASQPVNGTLSGTAPNLIFTPALNFNGIDSFTFSVNDGTVDSELATVSITVVAVNDAPIANSDSVATNEDTSVEFVLTGSDEEGDALTYALASQPTNGTLSGTAPNLIFTPNNNFNGNDSFTFSVNDGTVDSELATVSITVVAVNDAPVANSSSVETSEDTSVEFVLTGSDEEGDALTYALASQPVNGTLSGTAPNLIFTPALNFNGIDSFTFSVNDGTVDSALATVSITVVAVNDTPVANSDSVETNEDTSVEFTLTGSDEEGDALTYALISQPSNGTLSGTAPNLTFTPALNFNGTDSFTFSVNDGAVDSELATVSITVVAVNDAPIANSDSVATNEDTSVEFVLTGSDEEGDALTYALISQPSNGTLSGTAPNLTFTPALNFNGTDSFTFTVNDGTVDSELATVSITVVAVNDAPSANSDSVATNEDTAVEFTLTGSDEEGDALTYALASQPTNGTLSGTAPNLIFTPAANFNGTDSFTFSVNDGAVDSELATVSITVVAVNDAPIANSDSVATNEDTSVEFVLTGSDEEGDALTYALISQPSNGTLSGTAPNLIFTPALNFNGTDSFTFSVNDGTVDSALATVSITVVAVNDTPVANSDSVETNEDTSVEFTLTGSDEEGDALTYALASQPTNGTLSGTAPNLIFTPAANFNGTDSFTFSVNDGAVDSELATVSITVVAVNDAPIANSDSVATNEDTSVEFVITGSDEEGDALTYALISQPSNGTLSGTAPNLTFTPALNFNGTDSFTFSVNDGAVDSELATVSITVVAVNDAPIANSDSVATNEDTSVEFVLTGSDEEGDALTYALISQPSNGTLSGTAPNLTFTPALNFNGTDSFTFSVNDGAVDSELATVSITVVAVNDAPIANSDSVATNEDTSVEFVLTGSDEEGDALTYALISQPSNGTLSGTAPNLTFTPALNFNGTDSFTFTVNDGTVDSELATVSITVVAVNDAPSANSDSVATNEDTAVEFTLTGSDEEGDALTYALASQPTNGTLSGTAPNLIFTPAANFNGTDSFTFSVNDGAVDSELATVSITVVAVNDAPVANSSSVETSEDTSVEFVLTGSDEEGDVLTYALASQPTNGTLSGTAPNLIFTPAANFNGTDSFTFSVNDGAVDSELATVSITVVAVNDAPIANSDSVATNEDTSVEFVLTGSDEEGDALTYALISQPSNGTLSGTAPNLIFTPALNFNGTDSFTFSVNDGTVDSALATVSITVVAVNDTPVANSDSVETNEDTSVEFTLTGSDEEGDALTYALISQPSNGTLSGTAPNLIFTPNNNFNGNDSFTFSVNDGTVDSELATVSITVVAVNDAPFAQALSLQTIESQALTVVLEGSDIDSSNISYVVQSQPTGGVLSGAGSNYVYTPNQYFSGQDTFTYSAFDGELSSAIVQVDITVTALPDSDGDGFDNVDEIAAGTNPFDPNDYPDIEQPEISYDGQSFQITELDAIELTGTVIDRSAVTLILENSLQPGKTWSASVTNGRWSASLPLDIGLNIILLTATDESQNTKQITLNIEREINDASVDIVVISPVNGSSLDQDTVVITGQLTSSFEPESINFLINESNISLNSTDEPGVYSFVTGQLTLNLGENIFNLQATFSYPQIEDKVVNRTLYLRNQATETEVPLPTITLLSPANGSFISDTSFYLIADIQTFSGAATITLDGQPVALTAGQTQSGIIREIVSFTDGETTKTINLSVEDSKQQTQSMSMTYYRDLTKPQVIIENDIHPIPIENLVQERPYRITGKIIEENLVSFSVNNNAISLQATNNIHEYDFSFTVNPVSGVELPLQFLALDRAGNAYSNEYLIRLDHNVDIDIVVPPEGTKLIHFDEPVSVQVVARFTGDTSGLSAFTRVVDETDSTSSQIAMDLHNSLASTIIDLPASSSEYTIEILLKDSAGAIAAKTTRIINLEAEKIEELAIQAITPENNSVNVSPNKPITVVFNQAIDPNLLEIKINETAYGNTYIRKLDEPADTIVHTGYELQWVNRTFDPVDGGLSILPGNKLITFYPSQWLAYSADVFIEVLYDQQSLIRTQFHTRDLPTFISGGVHDQMGQTIAGIQVQIPELNRSTTTNSDGAFTFGYGDSAENNLPNGRYTLEINSQMANSTFGNLAMPISIKSGEMLSLGNITLPMLNVEDSLTLVEPGKVISLAKGELQLDLTDAKLDFSEGKTSGYMQAQFTELSHITEQVDTDFYANWYYAVFPQNTVIDGSFGIKMQLPKFENTYNYLPPVNSYLLILASDSESGYVIPQGIAQLVFENQQYFAQSLKHNIQNINHLGLYSIPSAYVEYVEAYLNDPETTDITELMITLRSELRSIRLGQKTLPTEGASAQ